MEPLDRALRNQLENTIREARDMAENAARVALEHLGVGQASPFEHLSEQDRELRRRLRAHGRQLGDTLNGNQVQTVDHLVDEVAYEHWHRMLFARFLAENNLLMYPDPDEPVAVTLEECEDLATYEGAANGWELAARFAAKMLPQIFRHDSPVFQLTLPPEHQQKLEFLLSHLPVEMFTASDSVGWVYQFWQAKRKDEVNQSEVKIGARELPAVTQLFTEPYMVSFLLDNSLGAWWATKRLTEDDFRNAPGEEDLRQKAAIPGVPLEYLRFVQEEDQEGKLRWTPAAGTFDRWPEQLADLKLLDPCCGSGHFLVAALLMLVPMRMERDHLTPREAVDAVLRENLHGLELDRRCVELAAFALALTAWKYPDGGGYRVLPHLNVACSGLSLSMAKEEWKQLGLGKQNLSIGLGMMHDVFQDAPVLGSLINPGKSHATKLSLNWDDLSQAVEQALEQEQTHEHQEAAVVAQGLARAATLLGDQYHWVVTNVPYLTRGKQDATLRDFCEKYYPAAKNDLATVFLKRCLEFCTLGGTASVVLPQNWLFLISYRKFREKLLKRETWNLIARLGSGAFETISGEVVQAILLSISHGNPSSELEGLFGIKADEHLLRGLDVSEPRTAAEKAAQLLTAEIKSVQQASQLENPDARLTLEDNIEGKLLESIIIANQGIKTGDDLRWRQFIWEKNKLNDGWRFYQSTVSSTVHYGGKPYAIDWRNKGIGMPSHRPTNQNINTKGVAVSQMRKLPAILYTGELYDSNVAPISPHNPEHIPAVWCFCSSPEYNKAIRQIDQSLKVTNVTLVKIPFDLDHWTKVAKEKYPNGLPQPYTDDPTQWIFHGHPCASVIWDQETKRTAQGPLRSDDTVLQVAVARLLGYQWPAELDPDMELAHQQRHWVNQCQTLAHHTDRDGIVCIPAVRGELPAHDRLLNLLAAAHQQITSPQGANQPPPPTETFSNWLSRVLTESNHRGKDLESWLREKFFAQHCKLFNNRPFIWHIWDGLPDGFAALVNYHKLNFKLLETLIYTYLGDWINRQKGQIHRGTDGAQTRLAAALDLKKKLELILKGEAPYDIFVRWKPLNQQPIGWNPDLNDGVRLNIRPFLTVDDVGKKGAGILRDRPNIRWNKDRGKDTETAPWYHLGPQYGGKEGDRINDHHLTLEEKQKARQNHGTVHEQ